VNQQTLSNAVKAAIDHGNVLGDINAARWAETFHCDSESVRDEWERQTAKGIA